MHLYITLQNNIKKGGGVYAKHVHFFKEYVKYKSLGNPGLANVYCFNNITVDTIIIIIIFKTARIFFSYIIKIYIQVDIFVVVVVVFNGIFKKL